MSNATAVGKPSTSKARKDRKRNLQLSKEVGIQCDRHMPDILTLEHDLARVRAEISRLKVDYALARSSMDVQYDTTNCYPDQDVNYMTKLGYPPSPATSNCSGFSWSSCGDELKQGMV